MIACQMPRSETCRFEAYDHRILQPTTALAEAAEQSAAIPQSDAASLAVYIDASGSCVRSALEEAWGNVRSALPSLIILG